MSKILKKIGVTIIGLSLLAMIAPGVAQADAVSDLQAQIATLTAQLAALQTQLTALGSPSTAAPAACTGITFTLNLSQGTSGNNVKCLQALLNTDATTQVAATGVGSLGNETTSFGPLTKAAVVKFQEKYAATILTPLGLTAGTGFVGAATRAKLNALLVATPPVACTTDAGCPTGKICQTGACVTPPTTGVEGSILASIAGTPASGAEVYINATGVGVTAVNVKAAGSDVLVTRFDLNFSKRPWLYISNITITDGTVTKTIAVTEANSTEITVGSSYTVRVEGLNINIPKDTIKVLTVKVDGASAMPGVETSTDVVLTIAANAIRGTDSGIGISQYAPTTALATRTFTVKSGDTAALEITANADNPKARPVLVGDTSLTTGVVLAKVDIKAKNKNAILRTVEFSDANAGSSTLSAIYLYDGDTLLSSTSSIVSTTSTFSNVNLTIPKDTTKTLTLKADVYKSSGYYQTGGGATASSSAVFDANASGFAAEDAVTYATATVTGSDVTAGVAYFFTKAPTLALASTSIVGLTGTTGSLSPQQAQATIRINVTANGGDIYIPIYSATNASSGLVASIGMPGSVTLAGDIITSNADYGNTENNSWVIRSGATKYIEYVGVLAHAASAGAVGFSDYMLISELNWGTTVTTALTPANDQTWGLTDLKTGPIFLQAQL